MNKIVLANHTIVTLPKGFTAQLPSDKLGYNVFYKDIGFYIPLDSSVMFVQEVIREVLLKSGMTPKEVTNYLLNSK